MPALIVVLIVFMALSAADVLLSRFLIGHGLSEGNPLVAAMPPYVWLAAKLLFGLALGWWAWWRRKKPYRLAFLRIGSIPLAAGLLMLIALWNTGIAGVALADGVTPTGYTVDSPFAGWPKAGYPTNLYSDGCTGFQYNLTGLDPATTYTFTAQAVDEKGQRTKDLWTTTLTGYTSNLMLIGPDCSKGTAGQNLYTGPLRVVDQWGRVIGRHYLAYAPGADWYTDHTVDDKYRQVISDVLQTLPANEVGYIRYKYLTSYDTTELNNTALLHYRAEVTPAAGQYIEVKNIVTHAVVGTVSLADLLKWDNEGGFQGFVVVSTDGKCPPIVDCKLADTVFASGHNPMRWSVPVGVYDYARKDATGNVLGVGEDVWIVAGSLANTTPSNAEWTFTQPVSVAPGGTVTIVVHAQNKSTWDAYPLQSLNDACYGGAVDTTAYDFVKSKTYTYTTTSTSPSTCIAHYYRFPLALNYGQTAADFVFDPNMTYAVSSAVATPTPTGGHRRTSIVSGITQLPSDMGWNNGVLTIFYIGLCVVSFILLGVVFHFRDAGAYIIIYELVTIGCLLWLPWDFWAQVTIGVVAAIVFGAWLLGFGRSESMSQ